jgi:hypothetical protein
MAKCNEARSFILKYLMQDIEAHEQERYSEIGKGERYFALDECDEEDEKEAERLSLALQLWHFWMDARNHEWGYYPGVEQKDWLIIARQIHQGIVERWEPDRMRDNLLFSPPPRISLWQRIKNKFSGTST